MPNEAQRIANSLGDLPQEMDLAYLAAKDFVLRHPSLMIGDFLYERSVHARVVIAYHERLAEAQLGIEQLEAEIAALKEKLNK